MIPSSTRYEPPSGRFGWREVFRREFHGLLAIGASFFVLDVAHDSLVRGRLSFDPLWSGLFLVTAAIFVVMTGLKRAGVFG